MISRIKESTIFKRVVGSDIFETMKHSQNYFIAQLVTTGLAFIAIPIFTRLFTQEDYGIVSVYNAYSVLFVTLLSANSHASVGRYYFEKKAFLGTTLVFTGLIFLISTLTFLVFYEPITEMMNLPSFIPFLLIPTTFVAILNIIYLQIIQAQKRSLESAVISVLRGVLSLGLAFVLVILMTENRYLGRIFGYLIVGSFLSLYFLKRIFSHATISFKKEYIQYILTYSIPLIPYALSATILAYFDRIMINDIEGAGPAGIYSLGYNIALILSMVISATQAALIPNFFEFLNKKQHSRLDALISKVFSIITLAALGLILFAKEIVILIVDAKFHEGLEIIPIIIIAYLFFGMFTVYGRYIGYAKKTIYSSLVMILSGLLNIVLNALLIPEFGYIAAGYTTAISYFVLFVLTWIVAKFIIKEKLTPLWKVWKPITIFFSLLALYVVLTVIFNDFLLLLIIKILILLFFCSLAFFKEINILITSLKTRN
ncbi:MAG: oligosaccharide flippase family protein [Candidatus Hodarchaeales archaeon]|jgi:O-antigen/teichoic acid export membrane protein